MRLVLDASVAVAAARVGEPSHIAARALTARVLKGEVRVVIPAIFPIEVASALVRVGEPAEAVRMYVEALVSVAEDVASIGSRRASQILEVAIQTRLRAADATYVWLVGRDFVPLCTLDRELLVKGTSYCQVVGPETLA